MAFLRGVIVFIVAMTMALSLSITLTMNGITQQPQRPNPSFATDHENKMGISLPSKRVSRFLARKIEAKARNPHAADHCKKEREVCYLEQGKNSTCCNNKCLDLDYDNSHCGACKNKCKFTQTCCRGQCVYLSFDKRNCGYCNYRCEEGEYCVYGMCNYA